MARRKRRQNPKHRKLLREHRHFYDALLELQGGRCFLCGKEPDGRKLDMDHNHKTMKLRGLLCSRCNRFGVKDWMTPEWAMALYFYLARPPFEQLKEGR